MSKIFIIFAAVCNSVRVICRWGDECLNDVRYHNKLDVFVGSTDVFGTALFVYIGYWVFNEVVNSDK
jgi:hypothetical protein